MGALLKYLSGSAAVGALASGNKDELINTISGGGVLSGLNSLNNASRSGDIGGVFRSVSDLERAFKRKRGVQ